MAEDSATEYSATATTVVIMTRNRRDELLRTLEHLTSLVDAAPVIVVDNGSTDGTAQAVRDGFSRVRLLESQDNLGAIARNWAVEHVDTRYVAFCDDDMRWQPLALTRAARILDTHPALGAVTGRCLVAPDLTEDPLTPELRASPIPQRPGVPYPIVLGGLAGTMMYRVAPFRAVGGYSRRLWFGGEEELLSIDLAARGWWTCWAEDVVVHHHPSRQRESTRRRQIGLRNTLWTAWLRRPVRGAVRRSVDVLSSAPKDTATLAAVGEAVKGAPWVLRERRRAPDSIERALRLLEAPQRDSQARRYVG